MDEVDMAVVEGEAVDNIGVGVRCWRGEVPVEDCTFGATGDEAVEAGDAAWVPMQKSL
jgi:hypothetical protein